MQVRDRQASESLAGRIEIIELRGFDLGELPVGVQDTLWLRGGFPRAFLASDDEGSVTWRKNFIQTFLERDLAALGFGLSPSLMSRFWTMRSHYHAQVLLAYSGSNASSNSSVADARFHADSAADQFARSVA